MANAGTSLDAPSVESCGMPEVAQSSPIAGAVRRFGDDYPVTGGQLRVRSAAVLLALTSVIYVPWMLTHLNPAALWFPYLFAAANLFTVFGLVLAMVNAWKREIPPPRKLPVGNEPWVAVIIPTCGEPIPMVMRTLVSVISQNYPRNRLVIVVSDDAHNPRLKAAAEYFGAIYHEPPPLWAPGRDGAPKSGNLNSAVQLLDRNYPWIRYIETRDADDEVGSADFMRLALGQLEHDARLAYVQTIKETQVSAGDPFNNRDTIFYRGQMLSRNASNAVFPCGSGLVWRRTALRDIGDFPTWNLVEDLQSGFEALKRGWRGMYVPIVGAVGQHSPEDVPNVYKQRGTWAIDTVRLMVWKSKKGLNLRQRLQFTETLFFYLNGFTVIAYVPAVGFTLLGYPPLTDNQLGFIGHMLPMVLATELWLLAFNHPYNDRRSRQRAPFRALWRVRILWAGLAPIFMKASILAVANGPNKKPTYKVTRKTNDARWHWRATLPQTSLVGAVAVAGVYAAIHDRFPEPLLLIGSMYWGGLNVLLLSGFVKRGWHGLQWLGQGASGPLARLRASDTAPEPQS